MPEEKNDSIFARWSEQWRGLASMGAVLLIGLAGGTAIGSLGLRDTVDEIKSEQRVMRENIARNESNITALVNDINDLNLEELADQVGGLRRELCLMRYDRAGTVGPREQQECSNLD